MQKSLQAVTAYRQAAAPEQTLDSRLLRQAGDFLNNAKAMLVDVQSHLQSLAEPRRTFEDLFAEIGLLNKGYDGESERLDDNALFAGVIDHIGQALFAEAAEHQAA
nr:hypothetical protein [Methylomarinum sp. Ch1-1]MDP4519122.1 hypothetical protein [Methylomarinum sp. Ch1-1]